MPDGAVPPWRVRSANLSSSPVRIWVIVAVRNRAAASSRASGRPSSCRPPPRRQVPVASRPGERARRAPGTAGPRRNAAARPRALARAGPPADAPATRSRPRPRALPAGRQHPQRPGPAQETVNQLRHASAEVLAIVQHQQRLHLGQRLGHGVRPALAGTTGMVRATAAVTAPGPVSGARSIHQTPPGKRGVSVAARRSASRVLPAPPAPVSVSSRPRRSRSAHRARSPARPTNELISAGRLPRTPRRLPGHLGLRHAAPPSKCDRSSPVLASTTRSPSARSHPSGRCAPGSDRPLLIHLADVYGNGTRHDARKLVIGGGCHVQDWQDRPYRHRDGGNLYRRGSAVRGTVYRPRGVTGPMPVVVMAHGPTLTRRDGIPAFARQFAATGYTVVAFDYRHWGDSDGHPRGWFSLARQQSDWQAAVAFARQLDGIDPGRVGVVGIFDGRGNGADDRRRRPADRGGDRGLPDDRRAGAVA